MAQQKIKQSQIDLASGNAYATTTSQSKSTPGSYTAVYYENHTKTFSGMPAGVYEVEFHTPYWFSTVNTETALIISAIAPATANGTVGNTRTGYTDGMRMFGYVSTMVTHPGGNLAIRIGAHSAGASTIEIRGGTMKVRRFI